jgi:hypothetical protein
MLEDENIFSDQSFLNKQNTVFSYKIISKKEKKRPEEAEGGVSVLTRFNKLKFFITIWKFR